jgi:hypothetical protein
MKTLMSVLMLVLGSLSFAAHAADAAACEAQTTEKKLAGAAKASFLKKCEAPAEAMSACQTQAGEKKLAGAAKTSFLKKCEADAKAGAPADAAKAADAPKTACESQAADKKLSGAARTSFLKKCKAAPAKPAS